MGNKEIFETYETNKNGLTNKEVNLRLDKYGKNILPTAKKDTILKVVLRQLNSPIIYMLVVAIILSLLIGETIDAIFIFFIILMDIVLSTAQEWKAETEAKSLEKLIEIDVEVLRDNEKTEINSAYLVKGDIIYLTPGDKVAADIVLIEVSNLEIDESSLTGESIPILKRAGGNINDINSENLAYAGTSVIKGRAVGIVIATSCETEIGKIATLASKTDLSKPPLVIRMEKFTKQISLIIIVVALIIMFILYLKGYVLQDIFLAVIALCVSAIPEGLPIAMIVALSTASSRLAKKNVLVKRLNSVESLGSCTIIASDKTGTLTLNQQTAKLIVLPNDNEYQIDGIGYNGIGNISGKEIKEINKLALMGVLNNESTLRKKDKEWIYSGDAIDVAFLSLGYKANIMGEASTYRQIDEIPYEAELKYSAGLYENGKKKFMTIKGSFEVVVSFCKDMLVGDKVLKLDIPKLNEQNQKLASSGYRVIAICHKETSNDKLTIDNKYTFIGFVAFIDPIREDTLESLEKCISAGVKVVMVTGDHPLTAFSVAKELKIVERYDEVATSNEIENYFNRGKKEFDNFIKGKKVFTRVTPIQKLEIINSYKRQGEYIAVTGDGVNDALALKAANIGVAMGSGTDVAKESSSMIITDDNFKSIVMGIEEGRNAYNNVRKVTYMLLSTAVAEVLFFILSIILNLPMPLIAIQILWLNIITNGIQDVALAFEKGEKEVMQEKPRNPDEKVFDKLLLKEMFLSGFSIGIVVFIVWMYLIKFLSLDVVLARSYIVILMVFMQNIHTFNCRSEKKSTFKIPIRNNPFVVFSVIGAIILQFIILNIPFFSNILKIVKIPLSHIIILFILAIPILFVMEIFKYIQKKNN